jgi:hypothetical protein
MSETDGNNVTVPRELCTQISKDQCAVELEQLNMLIRDINNYVKAIDTKVRQLEVLEQKIFGILKHEVEYSFTK